MAMTEKPGEEVRIDKFLWSVRIFKTRSIAAGECKKGRILVSDSQAKPSRLVSSGEIIRVKKAPVIYTYRILDIPGSRLPAKLVTEYIEDLTPDDEKEKLNLQRNAGMDYRYRGSGRPTKKERRDLDKLKGS